MFDWQDMRHFAVLARLGTLSGAARELGVDHATVGRRVAAIEERLGLRLIDRLPRSCPLTPDGVAIAAIADRMEQAAHAAQRLARGASSSLSGTVRVSAPPALAAHCIAPCLASLRQAHPELKVILLGSPSFAALDRGEADIAIRMVRPKEAGAVTRKIGTMGFAAYARTDYAARPPAQWEFIAFDQALDHVPQQAWLKRILAGRSIAFEASDLFSQQAAARAGVGIAILPTIMGDNEASLVRVVIDPEPPKRDLWMVTYPDLRRSPAVRAVLSYLEDSIAHEPRLRR